VVPTAASDHTVSTSLSLPSCAVGVALPAATSIFHSLLPGIAPAHTVPSEVWASATTAIAPGNVTSFFDASPAQVKHGPTGIGAEQDAAVGEP